MALSMTMMLTLGILLSTVGSVVSDDGRVAPGRNVPTAPSQQFVSFNSEGKVLSAKLTVGAPVYTVLAWKNRYWGIAACVHYTLVTVAAVTFVWFLNQWNLLGWRY